MLRSEHSAAPKLYVKSGFRILQRNPHCGRTPKWRMKNRKANAASSVSPPTANYQLCRPRVVDKASVACLPPRWESDADGLMQSASNSTRSAGQQPGRRHAAFHQIPERLIMIGGTVPQMGREDVQPITDEQLDCGHAKHRQTQTI
ncbi:hypothetical protein KCP77_22120 [Salmonella enterica subsp. enterica]|nr:hypothetical protein KCP77_22120 [Salmonella enterica subsp. enterica]